MQINTPVSVVSSFNHQHKSFTPKKILWKNQEYVVSQVGLHHTYRQGRTLFHVFSVTSNSIFFRLVFNTDNLFWILEEVSDGI